MITIDIPNRKLTVALSDEEMVSRIEALPAFVSKVDKGYLKRYSKLVTSASTGAVFED